eukprot:GEMP01021364.1.p1 GENE.GEMP01021364.1~~GEMP01021364.1.p1  ORF type:complete len:543 (+),score=90.57 GEMP01021364.1:205-1833(+)
MEDFHKYCDPPNVHARNLTRKNSRQTWSRDAHALFISSTNDFIQRANACSERITGLKGRLLDSSASFERHAAGYDSARRYQSITSLRLNQNRFAPPPPTGAADAYRSRPYVPLSARAASPTPMIRLNTDRFAPPPMAAADASQPYIPLSARAASPSPLIRPRLDGSRASFLSSSAPCPRTGDEVSQSHHSWLNRAPVPGSHPSSLARLDLNGLPRDARTIPASEHQFCRAPPLGSTTDNGEAADDSAHDRLGFAPKMHVMQGRVRFAGDDNATAAQHTMSTNVGQQMPPNVPPLVLPQPLFERFADSPSPRLPRCAESLVFGSYIPTPARNRDTRTRDAVIQETLISQGFAREVYTQTSPTSDDDVPINRLNRGGTTNSGAQTVEQFGENKVEQSAVQAHIYGPPCLLGVLHVNWVPTTTSHAPDVLSDNVPVAAGDISGNTPPLMPSESSSDVTDERSIRHVFPNICTAAPGGNRYPRCMRPSEKCARRLAELDNRHRRTHFRPAPSPVRAATAAFAFERRPYARRDINASYRAFNNVWAR